VKQLYLQPGTTEENTTLASSINGFYVGKIIDFLFTKRRLEYTSFPTLTVVIPLYNEEKIVMAKTAHLIKYLRRFYNNFEVLLSENGSTDRTLEIVKELSKSYKEVSYCSLPNPDFCSAIKAGVRASKSEKVVWMGIDYSKEVTFITQAEKALDDFDIVLGSKKIGKDYRKPYRIVVSRGFNFLVRLIFGLHYADVEGYQAYRKSMVIDLLDLVSATGHLFNLELLLLARKKGLIVAEIPIVVYEIRKSKYLGNFRKLLKAITISLIGFISLKRRERY